MIWILLFGCADQEKSAISGLDSAEETVVEDACADAPVVTYESFGQGFIRENCQSCHASSALNRYGAPESVIFDTHEDVIAQANDILQEVTGNTPRMPPAGGVELETRELVSIWLTCYENEQ